MIKSLLGLVLFSAAIFLPVTAWADDCSESKGLALKVYVSLVDDASDSLLEWPLLPAIMSGDDICVEQKAMHNKMLRLYTDGEPELLLVEASQPLRLTLADRDQPNIEGQFSIYAIVGLPEKMRKDQWLGNCLLQQLSFKQVLNVGSSTVFSASEPHVEHVQPSWCQGKDALPARWLSTNDSSSNHLDWRLEVAFLTETATQAAASGLQRWLNSRGTVDKKTKKRMKKW